MESNFDKGHGETLPSAMSSNIDEGNDDILPWVVSYDYDKGNAKLFDPSTERTYVAKSLPSGSALAESKNGWILFSKRISDRILFFFYSPFRNKIIELPTIKQEIYYTRNSKSKRCKARATFSSNPTSPDCMVMVMSRKGIGGMKVQIYRFADKSWKTVRSDSLGGELFQIVHSGIFFYFVFSNGAMQSFDIDKEEWRLLPGKVELGEYYGHQLISSFNGDLLLHHGGPYFMDGSGSGFHLLDVSKREWIPVSEEKVKKLVIFANEFDASETFAVPISAGYPKELGGKFHPCPEKAYVCLNDPNDPFVSHIWVQSPF